ncbi:MAG: 3-oxoadipate enol-lactonase, partial [Paracoccaceae bacterium]
LGLDLRLWEGLFPLLPAGLRLISYDARGHGGSSCPPGPYSMGALIRDAERLLDNLGIRDCTFVGASMGGLVAQGLAVKRLDLVRALVLANTAVKIGTPAQWQARAAAVEEGGMIAIADQIHERWFSRRFRQGAEASIWRDRLIATPTAGYIASCAAIAGADFLTPTSGLRLPTLVLAGSEDRATPPDLVAEIAGLIPGARYRLIRGAGHLPAVDAPLALAAELAEFLRNIGHG